MKKSSTKIAVYTLAIFLLVSIFATSASSQYFQRDYGTSLNNSFTRVIKDGSNYYVLGQDEPSIGNPSRATVTRLDANGLHQWTLSLNIASVWNDAVLTPSGDLLVVGATLPLDATNKSLIGLVTPTGGGGFTWVRSYDVTGRENLSHIVRNPNPENPAFPYYILGSQWDSSNGSATWDDVIMMNINAAGTFNWKKIFNGTDDDEFGRDFEALPNGDLILAGNLGSLGVIIRIDNTGAFVNGSTPIISSFTYADIAQESGGGFYAVGTTFPNFLAHVMKYDNNIAPVWEATISGLTAVNQVWEGPSGGELFVTGRGVFNGINRGVILRLTDGGSPNLQWAKYLDNGETGYQGGSTNLVGANQIAFTDGRIPSSGGFGSSDAYMSVSDLDLTTCMTVEDFVGTSQTSYLYNGPNIPLIEFFDFPTGTDLTSSSLNWQQEEICNNDPCQADFIIIPSGACGHYQVSNTSTGVQPLTYLWCNGSISEDLDVMLPCGPQTFCLTITDATGCMSNYTQTITVTDNVPPIAVCAPPFAVTLDSNCMYLLTPAQIDAGSSDNCQIQSVSISPAILNGCGTFPVTLTVTDWCGNTSTCTTEVQTHENVPPIIHCPQDLTVNTDPGQCFYSGSIPVPTATDNCNPNPIVNCYLVTSGGLIPITTQTVFQKGENTICCVADDGCVDVSKIICTYPCSSPIPFNGDPLSLKKMDDDADVFQEASSSVLDVQPGISADVLVKDIFVGGNCFDISNVTSFGDSGQLGTFSNGLSTIGFASGVILSTGPCVFAIGPNDDDGKGNISGTLTPDADLSTLTTGTLLDKAALEFEFIPAQTPVTFSFVFAAEEYCEFVGSPFNDVLGFFISGPGIPGGKENIALVPSTTTPISVNTVNHLTNSGFYVNNQPASSSNLCGQTASASPATAELQYDGFTRKFIAVANVVPGQTYHLKLAIADVTDNLRDAAVFLQAGSFDAGGNVSAEWMVNSAPVSDTAYENCGTVDLVFSRVGGNIAVPVTVPFTIAGTAIPGVDYVLFTSPIIIPANQSQFILPVTILNDGVLEADETITIAADPVCSILHQQSVLTIRDRSLLQAKCTYTVTVIDNEPPIILCPPDVTVTGAITPDGHCAALVTNLTPTPTDNCPMLMVDYTITGATAATGVNDASGTTFFSGTSTVHYTATDMGGNISTCDVSVTVNCTNPCDTFSISLSTGWDNQNSVVLPIGGVDTDTKLNLDWLVTSDPKNPPPPGGRPANVIQTHPVLWDQPFTNSQWISPSPTLYQGTLPNGGTPFTLECNFDLPAGFYNPSIDLQMRADERIDTVYLNNNVIYAFSPPQVDGGFFGPPLLVSSNNPAFFQALQNKLSIDYRDVSGDVTGFNLEGGVTYGICDTCQCGIFSDMAIRFERGPGQPLTCGGPPVTIDCPPPGYSYSITGKFECQGSSCPLNPTFDSQLQLPDGTIINYPGQTAGPYFGIPISNLDLQQAGIFTVTFTGHCGSEECRCVIKFLLNTPCIDVCPCSPGDIQAFSAAVQQGFAEILSSKSCKACFSPIALGPCETVQWYLTNTGGTPIGTSSGNNTFCFSFPGSGTYNVIMVVTRRQDDGTSCETFTKSQTVTVTCLNQPECNTSIFPNPTFSEGAIAGGLNSGGQSNGWKASSGNPKLKEDQITSSDGWTMQLSGNLDTADILTTVEPVCLARVEGMIGIRIAVGDSAPGGIFIAKAAKEKPEQKMKLAFSRSVVQLNHCDGIDCYSLAAISYAAPDSGEWLDVFIPYDLSQWDAFDPCGGVLVYPGLYVTNALANDQGGEDTYSFIQVDNLCINGTIVAVDQPAHQNGIHIFPNPTSGELILQFSGTPPNNSIVQMIDLYGRLLKEEKLEPGRQTHTLSLATFTTGVYFVKVTENGMPVWMEKVIKQ